jgi:hypothetical protein
MLLMVGCDVESSDNGNLDGFWQMTTKTDKYAKCGAVDMRDSGLTWSFQGKLLELRDVNDRQKDIVLSFDHAGNTLRVYNPYIVERDSDDIKISDPMMLLPYGVFNTDEKYDVVELKSDKMVLESERFLLKFRKY